MFSVSLKMEPIAIAILVSNASYQKEFNFVFEICLWQICGDFYKDFYQRFSVTLMSYFDGCKETAFSSKLSFFCFQKLFYVKKIVKLKNCWIISDGNVNKKISCENYLKLSQDNT